MDEEVIEETMMAGVTKFVVSNVDTQVKMIEEIVNNQGKQVIWCDE